MNHVLAKLTSGDFWWGAVVVVAGLWLYKNYGDRLPRLPLGSGS